MPETTDNKNLKHASKNSAARAEKALELSNKLLQAITTAQSEFIINADPRQLFDKLLENLLSITESEYGFIGEILYDSDKTIFLKTHAITNIAWNEETRKFYEENAPKGLEFHNLNTLFGTVLTTAEPVISNDPDTDPRAGGRPQGHPPLNAFLGLPFFSGREFIGMVGIANRSGGYDENLILFLRPFLTTCGNIIQAFRSEQNRIKAEDALKQSEIKKRTILETVASSIITIDANRIIQDFNPAAERTFGYSAQEVMGRNINILMPEPYRSTHDEFVQNYLKTGIKKAIGLNREVLGKHKDGTVFPLELTVNEMYIGSERMFVGILTDITLRKQAEASLIAAKNAAEETNRLKSDFLNVISHELRTPLTVILGSASLLTDADNLPDADEASEIAKDIERDGYQLLELINQTLDLSSIEADKLPLYLEDASALMITEDAVKMIKPLADEKGLAFKTQIEDIIIHADVKRIKQILISLIDNAIKFTDKGDVGIRVFQSKDMANFEISDTGCGIDENHLPHIFEVFRQADGSSTRKASGIGLGLTIAKRLIEMQQGEIRIKSKLNKGSVFTFTIPLAKT